MFGTLQFLEEDCVFVHIKQSRHFGILALDSALLFFLKTRDMGEVKGP